MNVSWATRPPLISIMITSKNTSSCTSTVSSLSRGLGLKIFPSFLACFLPPSLPLSLSPSLPPSSPSLLFSPSIYDIIIDIGDPFEPGNYTVNSRELEVAVLDFYARLWHAKTPHNPNDPDSYWGYILSMGSTEGMIKEKRERGREGERRGRNGMEWNVMI